MQFCSCRTHHSSAWKWAAAATLSPLESPSLNGATRMCFLPGMEEGMEIASKRQLNCLAQLRPPSPAPLILLPDMFSEDCWREMGSLATVSWEDWAHEEGGECKGFDGGVWSLRGKRCPSIISTSSRLWFYLLPIFSHNWWTAAIFFWRGEFWHEYGSIIPILTSSGYDRFRTEELRGMTVVDQKNDCGSSLPRYCDCLS